MPRKNDNIHGFMSHFPTDAASAEKMVGDVLDNCTDAEYDGIAKAFLGEHYGTWKDLKAAGAMDGRDRKRAMEASGPSNVTGGQPKPVAATSAAAAAALARFQKQ